MQGLNSLIKRGVDLRSFLYFVMSIAIWIFPVGVSGQWSASLRIANQAQVLPNTYEYEVYIQNTSSQPIRLHSYQFGVGFDTSILNGGQLQVQYVDSSSQLTNPSQAPFWQYDSMTATVFSNINVGSSIYSIAGLSYRFINNTAVLPPSFAQSSLLPVSTTGCPQPGVRIGRFRAINSVPFARASRPFHVFSDFNAAGVTRSVVSVYLTPSTQQFLYPNASSNALGLVGWNTAGTCDVNPFLNCRDSVSISASICAPDSFLLGGIGYTVSGNFQAVLNNIYGCDSVISLGLVVSTPPMPATLFGSDSLCVGVSSLFSASVTGGVWTSSNTTILQVDSNTGTATGLSSGTADLIYTIQGSGACQSVSSTRSVVISPRPLSPVLSVSSTFDTLFSNILTGNRWFRDGVLMPNFSNAPLIVVPGNGDYRCIIESVNGCFSDSSNLVRISSAGLGDKSLQSSVKLYPNPSATRSFFIDTEASERRIKEVKMWDTLGGEIPLKQNERPSENAIWRVEAPGTVPGVYYVLIMFSDGSIQTSNVIFR